MPTPSTDLSSSPQRILIVRLSALGDLVFCTSLLDGLRRAYPDAQISWLAQSGFAGILREDPRIDQLISVPKSDLSSLSALWRLRRKLRAQRFDWVIDAQGLAKSRILAWLAGGRRRVGFRSKEPLAGLLHQTYDKGGEPSDIASEYRYLAEQLTGAPAAAPRLPITSGSRDSVDTQMQRLSLEPGFVALCPFTTRPQKHWFDDHWQTLAGLIAEAGLGRCVVFGGPADRTHAQALVEAMPAGSLSLAGDTALHELPAWLERAGLVIGVDTGLTHIGIAVQRPTVALFGSTCPYTGGADSPLRVLYDALPCAPCKRRPTCDGAFICMRQLTPPRVIAAARELLGAVA
ncbi:glycosyltransferase family 9 protein [Sinimarinibacterium sp. CAU 1509]|uniref:glycosyltransferase family 9 protein n=1 Tax=Sinimarinibacterium sp. CAU 1509 TaxID=2562283 RepID=UPI0010AC3F8F|nr:glycosyltransferase family 9 protein [Sinimarinibacterium sp. CAU 1509]TJY59326.1 glycosyltransferase family 9 protein [Sinimarinibacterium sp. CAU 1509]